MTSTFRFGDFELDCRSYELRKRGRRLRVQQQPFQILATLVAASGNVVTRQELRDRVWGPETHVDFERAINKAVNRLRQLLGDDVARPRFIETLPKRGYRFVAEVAPSASRRPPTGDARETYLKARYFWNKRTHADLTRSVEYFRRTIEKDPDYALAWTGLADAYVTIGIFGLQPPHDVFPPAKAAAERALGLDDALAEAHVVLAEIHKFYDWNWEAAERSYQRAIELDSNYALAHQWYAQLLSILGRHGEAVREIETARHCDPLSVPINAFLSYVWLEARRYEEAAKAAYQTLELDANASLTHFILGRAYAKLGQLQEAANVLETAARLGGNAPLMESMLGYVHARAGARPHAQRILESLRERGRTQYVSPIDLALVSLGLGDTDGAVAGLEDAYRARSTRMIIVGDPFFSELGSDVRYRQLLTRLGLPLQS
jgi:DNA-binding winged helix-turn-helix (wHTH) protein/Flp pilus assembly protein TadD